MATIEYKLPEIGEGITEAEVVRWLVKPGDSVALEQPLVEVMTDKATVEIPSPVVGTVTELKAEEGDVVPVEGVLLILTDAGGGAAAPAPAASAAPAAAAAPAAPVSAPAAAPAAVRAPAGGQRVAVATPPPPRADGSGPVLAAPATRKLARELGLDLARIPGSGRNGRVTPDDVQRFAAAGGATPAARPSAAAAAPAARLEPIAVAGMAVTRDVERVKLKGLRRRISQAMVKSKYTAPHFSYVDEIDMSRIVALRQELKPVAAERGVKLTYLPFIMKAAVHALKAFPIVNSSLDDEAGEIVYKRYYNLAVSVATEAGLAVPVVRDVDKRSLLDVASELQRVGADARVGKSRPEDVGDSTFTLTSAGNIGGLFAAPIINHPEVAIIGVHVIKKRPIVTPDGEIVARDMMYMSMSCDHRVVDGAVAAEFVNCITRYLQEPGRLLLDAI